MATDKIELNAVKNKLKQELLKLGFNANKLDLNSEKIRSLDESFGLLNVKNHKFSVFVTQGCSGYCEDNSKYRDEYVVDARLTNALKLVELISYFHISKRTLGFSETIKVGAEIENIDYVFISVPFFFPGSVNNIHEKDLITQLKWVMPIHAIEAQYINEHGSEAFEKKLLESKYGFFDDRTNFQYLD